MSVSATSAVAPVIDGYAFALEDRPTLPGSPLVPPHPFLRRVGYALVGTWIGATATLANALVVANLTNLSGEYGRYVSELSWLPAIYVAFNVSANLLLVRARAQLGVARIMTPLFIVYALLATLPLASDSLAVAVTVRAMCGIVSAGMTAYGIYYWLQALPAKARPVALIIVLGLTQFGNPIARLLPVDLLATSHWHGLHCVELALVLTTLVLTRLLPLPPSEPFRKFSPLDVATLAMVLPAMLCLCIALSLGRLYWWTDTPLLGVLFLVAIPLLVVATSFELLRRDPLLHLEWISSTDIVRFALVALLMRLALAEQTYGSVGFLTSGGLNDDQLRALFGFVLLGMTTGIVAGSLTLSERALPYQVIAAALAISIAAYLDSLSSNLTRPTQLYFSQALIGFGTCMFIGPTLAHGIIQVIKRGPTYLVSLVVVFSITQNVGSLIGSAALGSYQMIEARDSSTNIAGNVLGGDPQVTGRLAAGAAALAGTIVDPQQRSVQSAANLGRSLASESNVLGFNAAFRLVALFTLAVAAYVAFSIVHARVVRPKFLETT